MSQTSLTFVPADFLHSLCKFIVVQAAARTPAVTLNYQGDPPRDLWRNLDIESQSGDPATVLRIYPWSAMKWTDRVPRLAMQMQTTGQVDDAVSTQIQTVFECLLDGDGLPLCAATINGYKAGDDSTDGHYLIVSAFPQQRPGVISRDDRGRVTWGCNFELTLRKVS